MGLFQMTKLGSNNSIGLSQVTLLSRLIFIPPLYSTFLTMKPQLETKLSRTNGEVAQKRRKIETLETQAKELSEGRGESVCDLEVLIFVSFFTSFSLGRTNCKLGKTSGT